MLLCVCYRPRKVASGGVGCIFGANTIKLYLPGVSAIVGLLVCLGTECNESPTREKSIKRMESEVAIPEAQPARLSVIT
jgi:hypothetical protein